jgi:SOS-response transcriptional repressor LexA
MTYAKGDSMEGVHIHNGDMLFMDNASRYYNHDVVLARVDGEELLKTYYVDEEDRHWLLPSNSDYDAILLTEDTDVQFCGRMIWHVDSPRETTRNLREATNTWGRFFFV